MLRDSTLILADAPLWFLRTFAIAFGLIWGSFLNVVIYRVPRDMSVVRPGSHCPACGTPIAGYYNVPVLSYLLLRGRAACCGAKMSPRYPLVELLGGALSLAIIELVVRPMPATEPLGRALAIYGADFTLCMGLTAAAFIDLEWMLLPDAINLGGTVLGVATASLRGVGLVDSVVSAASGYGVIWLVGLVYKWIRGRTGAGLGDAKLLMLAGAWFGWHGVYFTLLAGSVQGTATSLAVYAVRGKIDEPAAVKAEREELEKEAAAGDVEAQEILDEDPVGKAPAPGFFRSAIPFGPFLILAILEMLFLQRPIFDLFDGLMGR
jgi:leader peptidase (prepilin peptidase) / N-methyltransferase